MNDKESGIYFCQNCDYVTEQKSRYERHKASLSFCFNFKCKTCDFKTSLKKNISEHKAFFHQSPKKEKTKEIIVHSNFVQSCNQCDFLTNRKESLAKHKKTGCYKFQCKICNFKTSQYDKHLKHRQVSHSTDKKFICYSCDYKVVLKKDLETHLLNNSCYKFHCKSCDFKTSMMRTLHEHTRNQNHQVKHETIHSETIKKEQETKYESKVDPLSEYKASYKYSCQNCDYKCIKKRLFEKHKLSGTCFKFQCINCNYQTSLQRNLTDHAKIVHKIDDYKRLKEVKAKYDDTYFEKKGTKKTNNIIHSCQNCDYRTHDKERLKSHLEKFEGCFRHACHWCDFKTSMQSTLTKHNQDMHLESLNFKCDECSLGFAWNYLLVRHKEAKHNVEVFHCQQCKYTSSVKYYLDTHMKKRHEIKKTKDALLQYPCHLCGEIIFGSQTYHQHLFQHKFISSDEGFSCIDCNFKGKQKDLLRKHILLEHKLEYKCLECKMNYEQLRTFRRHLFLKHDSRSTEFKCPKSDCKYETKRQDAMRRHVRITHEKVRYNCDLCPYTGTDKRLIRSHKEKKHFEAELKEIKSVDLKPTKSGDLKSTRSVDLKPTRSIILKPTRSIGPRPTSRIDLKPTKSVEEAKIKQNKSVQQSNKMIDLRMKLRLKSLGPSPPLIVL